MSSGDRMMARADHQGLAGTRPGAVEAMSFSPEGFRTAAADLHQSGGASETCAFLSGGGEMGALMRSRDWSTTPLGLPEAWPQSLKAAVELMLNSRFIMFIWWGRARTNLYNDAYRPFLGGKHPDALGQSARDVWAEIWDLIGPVPRLFSTAERRHSTRRFFSSWSATAIRKRPVSPFPTARSATTAERSAGSFLWSRARP